MREVVSIRVGVFIFLVVVVLVLLPLGVQAADSNAPFNCVTQTSPDAAPVTQSITAGQWDANKCQNVGPDGQMSNILNQALGEVLKNVTNVGNPANLMCNPVIPQCPCGTVPGLFGCRAGPNMNQCPCVSPVPNVPGGMVAGKCVAQNVCQGQTFTGLGGQTTGVGDIGGVVGDIFKGVFQQLLQGALGGGGGGGGGGFGGTGCTQYYQVSVPTSDPCAQYVPPVSGEILDDVTSTGQSNAQQLLDALGSLGGGGGSGSTEDDGDSTTPTNTSNQLFDFLNKPKQTIPTQTTTGSTQTVGDDTLGSPSNTVTLASGGTRGDIRVSDSGATIIANSRDVTAGSETSGFYGGDIGGFGQPQGIASRLCMTRPWSNSFISNIIPPTFFDGLCSLRGYQVGFPALGSPSTPGAPSSQTFNPTNPTPIPATTTVPVIQPKIDIWAVPDKVALGARTYIFWTTTGVDSCAVTSDDGSFSETSLSGGSATVPILRATVFTIRCVIPGGETITDEVVVGLGV